ncbi:MAG: transcriptional regulator with XRE-family HTH domain [Bacteriovoracaceae bacterium]|jgi:transcriptional regulator with XRE-family HTH domain
MKRSYQKIETPKTKALKRMRNSKAVSLRKLAKAMNIHESSISDRENGRVEYISDEYIRTFVRTLGYEMSDWRDFLNGKVTIYDLRLDCINIIEKLDNEKLRAIYGMLRNF